MLYCSKHFPCLFDALYFQQDRQILVLFESTNHLFLRRAASSKLFTTISHFYQHRIHRKEIQGPPVLAERILHGIIEKRPSRAVAYDVAGV
jgi:hypothetical protein